MICQCDSTEERVQMSKGQKWFDSKLLANQLLWNCELMMASIENNLQD